MRSASVLFFAYVAVAQDLRRPGCRRCGRSLRQATGTACPCTARLRISAFAQSLARTIFVSLAALPLCSSSCWRRPPSRGADLPAAVPRFQQSPHAAALLSSRGASIPSAATQRQRRSHPVAAPPTKLRQLCVGCPPMSPLRAQTKTDGRTDRQIDRQTYGFLLQYSTNYDNAWES